MMVRVVHPLGSLVAITRTDLDMWGVTEIRWLMLLLLM